MYKKIYDNQKETGTAKKNWEFFEPIHAFLYKKLEIVAPATCSTSSGVLQVKSDDTESMSSTGSSSTTFQSSFSRKRKVAEENSGINRGHKEKMERQYEFLGLFKKLVDHVTGEKEASKDELHSSE